jgi:beta-lactamase superfamily II metal-dependent hydrolase
MTTPDPSTADPSTTRKRKREPSPSVDVNAPRPTAEERQKFLKNKAQAAIDDAKKKLADAAARSAAFDAKRAVRPAGGADVYCGDGNLYLAFIPVDQGDCAIMSTPRGKVLLFDCGSDSIEGEKPDAFCARLQDIIKSPKFAGTGKAIDILITTHPDTDHYNKLKTVLGKGWEINVWYHSHERSEYNKARQTSAYLVNDCLGGEEGSAKHVVLNQDPVTGEPGKRTINKIDLAGLPDPAACPKPDGKGGILIVDEDICKISILAADVSHTYLEDNSNQNNRGSIVTLVECKGKKILMCGDATVNTEKFLLNTAKDRISNLDVLQAGHHGSINTSHSGDFMDAVNPALVVASAGREIKMHNLPSRAVIHGYRARMAINPKTKQVAPHDTYYWTPGARGSYYIDHSSSPYPVYTTGSYGQIFEVTI